MEQPTPSPDFVNHFFSRMIAWIESRVRGEVEHFMAHQFGDVAGRLHLHCGLSWPEGSEYRWKALQQMLWKEAGFNRILPWEKDAGFYIGRYIGRDAERADWNFRVGSEPVREPINVGRRVIAVSVCPDNSSREFRKNIKRVASMKTKTKKIETSSPKIDATKIVIYTDGSGARPDGTGSGHAWFRVDTNERKIVREDHLTNNQAEYKAVLSALQAVSKKAKVEVLTDSQIICYQLKGQYRTKDPDLATLHDLISKLIAKNSLTVSFVWIPRKENRAGMMI